MGKAKAHPGQAAFDFNAPAPASGVGDLAGIERQINELVGTVLNTDPRTRREIAAKMSDLLDDEISHQMLDAYASPARIEHKVPFSRLLALIAVTNRQDLLDPVLRKIGAALLVGNEVRTARLGQVEAMLQELQNEKRALRNEVSRIRGDD